MDEVAIGPENRAARGERLHRWSVRWVSGVAALGDVRFVAAD
jgi:hypothetical protein